MEEAMRRDLMLMEAILGQLLQSPDPQMTTSGIAQRLNVEAAIARHHLHLLMDKGMVQELDAGAWRLSNQGHDYLEGSPDQAMSLARSR
jgi:predicted transcriptional regulator